MDIVDEATAAEARFFSHHGETNETIIAVDELKSVAEEAASRFSQLSSLQLRIAESQSSRVFIKLLTSLSFKKAAVILSIPFSEALERETRYAIAFYSPHGCIVVYEDDSFVETLHYTTLHYTNALCLSSWSTWSDCILHT